MTDRKNKIPQVELDEIGMMSRLEEKGWGRLPTKKEYYMTDKPSEVQTKEFWERCGWSPPYIEGGTWKIKDEYGIHQQRDMPVIDLNNLFKYAVPKVIDKIMSEQECSSDLAYAILFKKWLQKLQLFIPHVALALFWVLRQVKEGK